MVRGTERTFRAKIVPRRSRTNTPARAQREQAGGRPSPRARPIRPARSRVSSTLACPTYPGESRISFFVSRPTSCSVAGCSLRAFRPGATVRPVDAALRVERPPERRNGRSLSATVEAPWRCGSARSSRNQPHTLQVEEEARAPRGPRRATCGMEVATGGRAGRRHSGHSDWCSPVCSPLAGRGRPQPSG